MTADGLVTATHPLRTIRESRGISRQLLAAESGLTPKTIAAIERGLTAPHRSTKMVLAAVLDVPLREIWPEEASALELERTQHRENGRGVWAPLPVPLAEPVTVPVAFRQSTLASLEICPRRTYYGLRTPDDLAVGYVEATGDLGSMIHLVFAEILRTLYRQSEQQLSTQEAIEVAYEVMAKSDIVLPADERDTLIGLTLNFCEKKWDTRRFMPTANGPAIEQRLSMEIKCQDGKTRTFTGQPDLLMADPPDGIAIYDWKSGRGQPKAPRTPPPEGEPVVGKKYLSDRGHWQLDSYGCLGLHEYPQANRATLYEFHLRSGTWRLAHLYRSDLEHVEREIGVQMMKLERGIIEGEESKIWYPRSGRQCLRQCPVAYSCPIPAEQRGIGAIESEEDADAQASRFMAVDGLRGQLRDRLKANYEETGYAAKTGDGREIRWKEKPTGGRSFGAHLPDDDVIEVGEDG